MKSICLYSSYVVGEGIPYYVQYYLQQLKPHFTKLIYITNERSLDENAIQFLEQHDIELLKVVNEGYDFGMWGKAIRKFNAGEYERIGLVNDSCILFRSLDADFNRIDSSDADFFGMVISDRYATHLQSFFLVINQKAIPVLLAHFEENGLILDYRNLIQVYEIGLSQRMLSAGMKVDSLYNESNRSYAKNPTFALVKELIDEGMPMIKKKVVFRNYRGLEYYWVVRMNFNTDYRSYFKQIRSKYKSNIIDLEKVMLDAPKKGNTDIYLFAIARAIANFFRAIPGMRWLFQMAVNFYKKYIR